MKRQDEACRLIEMLGTGDIELQVTAYAPDDAILAVSSMPGVLVCGRRAVLQMANSFAEVDALMRRIFR